MEHLYTEISLTLVVASTSHINCKQLYILYAIPLALPKKLLNDIDIEWCNLADTQKLLSSICILYDYMYANAK